MIFTKSQKVMKSCLKQVRKLVLYSNRCYSANPILDLNESYESASLKTCIQRRNLNIDLVKLKNISDMYQTIKSQKSFLEDLRVKISEEIVQLKNKNSELEENQLKIQAKILRNDLKTVKNVLTNVENDLMPMLLKLPNEIDSRTLDEEVEVFTSTFNIKEASEHHLKNGQDLIEYFSPTNYFLKHSAALYELQILSGVIQKLVLNGFTLISNPDFSRSSIVDICGGSESITSLGQCTSESDILYLNGGASHLPFLSFLFKTVIDGSDLPLRLVTQGRNYDPSNSSGKDLYSVFQNSAAQIFIATKAEYVSLEFDNIVSFVTEIYRDLNIPFRVIYRPAGKLIPAESIRADIQVYSSYYKKYIDVGFISNYTNYFSKRTNMFYSDEDVLAHTHIISGTVLKIPPLLAATLEYTNDCESLFTSRNENKS